MKKRNKTPKEKEGNDINIQNKHKYTFIWVLSISFILISIICVVGVILIHIFNTDYIAEGVEATLLASGLSIIGIAIAVWSGLNIANSISKRDFDKTIKRMSVAEEDIAKLEKIIAPLKDEASGINNTLRDLFLEELLKMPSIDIPSKYFYNRFCETEIPKEIISFLTKIEQTFYQVYMLHDTKAEPLLINKANSGIVLIDSAQEICDHLNCNSKEKDLLRLYFKQRKAEFNFYKGYEHNGYNNFIDALQEYESLAQDFGCFPMPDYNTGYIIPDLIDSEDTYRNFKIYLANTIGEAHSKIIDNYNQIISNYPSIRDQIEEHGYKAIFYCKCATVWESKTFNKPEVYYRNLGCAYERWDRVYGFGAHSQEIFQNYKKAFITMNFDERPARIKSVYHALLSYYHTYFVKKYDLFSKNSTPGKIEADDIVLLEEFYEYSMFAKKHFAKNNLPYAMNGFALTNILKVKMINKDSFEKLTYEFCLETIKSNLHYLHLLEVDDDYAKELRTRYDSFIET